MSKEITQEQINNTITSILEMQLEEEEKDLRIARKEADECYALGQDVNKSLRFRLKASFRNIELIKASLKYLHKVEKLREAFTALPINGIATPCLTLEQFNEIVDKHFKE